MQTICANTWCKTPFEITEEYSAFLKRVSPVIGNKKYAIPLPTHCPDCRLQQSTCHRNERFLHKNISALSGKEMISIYDRMPMWGKPYEVYTPEEWYGDSWNPETFAHSIDLSRPFFQQWAELHKAVPRMGLIARSRAKCNT
ncbi:MAG: hypothetical protein AAB489_02900 [Patescibacteria group bacterium]